MNVKFGALDKLKLFDLIKKILLNSIEYLSVVKKALVL